MKSIGNPPVSGACISLNLGIVRTLLSGGARIPNTFEERQGGMKLSERIREKMAHCKKCGGKIVYISPEYSVRCACPSCTDDDIILRGVQELESDLAKYNKLDATHQALLVRRDELLAWKRQAIMLFPSLLTVLGREPLGHQHACCRICNNLELQSFGTKAFIGVCKLDRSKVLEPEGSCESFVIQEHSTSGD